MADIWSSATRSEVMSRIRSQGNKKTELRPMDVMRQHRITGWRRHQALPGNRLHLPAREGGRLVVFVDGCLWHGCPKCYRAPTRARPTGPPSFQAPARGTSGWPPNCAEAAGACCASGSTSCAPSRPGWPGACGADSGGSSGLEVHMSGAGTASSNAGMASSFRPPRASGFQS